MTSQKLPDRALFAFYEDLPLYNTQQLREIGNTYGISKRKKQFYEHCDRASIGYHRDRMLERDFYHLRDAISTNQKASACASKFADTLEIYNDLSPAYSWYGEMCYKHRCFVDTVELHSMVVEFIKSMKIVVEDLPSVPSSRRPRLARISHRK
jgi:hypothetical protein